MIWNHNEFLLAGVLESYDECLKLKRIIDPILLQSEKIFDRREYFKQKLSELSQWTESSIDLMKAFDELCDDETNSVVTVLIQTTVIEHGLGNVFKSMTTRLSPHLLKDLLRELAAINDLFSINQVATKIVNFHYIYKVSFSDFDTPAHHWIIKRSQLKKPSLAWIR